MIKIIAMTVAVLALSALAIAGPPVISSAKRKFDHSRHAASASASGKSVDCASCHPIDADGARQPVRDHQRCASCHAFPTSCTVMTTPGPKGAARVCQVCHVPTRPDCLPKDLPPLPTKDTFTARFDHGPHAALGGAIEAQCATCHPGPAGADARRAPPAHKQCATCHVAGRAQPAITACAGCHVAATPSPAIQKPPDPFRLEGFDHKRHVAASKQNACASCHDNLGTASTAVPHPTMASCQTRCHNGKTAFSATGTRCTQCHRGTQPPAPITKVVAFTHGKHAARKMAISDCATCHAAQPGGELAPTLAAKDHAPCANSGCHQNEFMTREPRICGMCHQSATPWHKALAMPRSSGADSEWAGTMNHFTHLVTTSTGGSSNVTCTGCHGDLLAGGKPPEGHAACASCHARSKRPLMGECAACHVPLPAGTPRSEWSVRATFAHVTHAKDPRSGGTPACIGCHTNVASAKTRAELTPPKMEDCESCHNGNTAFKTTGFDCARCHQPANRTGVGVTTSATARAIAQHEATR